MSRWRECIVDSSRTKNFQFPKGNSVKYDCEIWKRKLFFLKNVCVFFYCVCFLPRSLLSFGKNLDSKRTIYFEWPCTVVTIKMWYALTVILLFTTLLIIYSDESWNYIQQCGIDRKLPDVYVLDLVLVRSRMHCMTYCGMTSSCRSASTMRSQSDNNQMCILYDFDVRDVLCSHLQTASGYLHYSKVLHTIPCIKTLRERQLFPTDLKIWTMFRFGWVGGSRQNIFLDPQIFKSEHPFCRDVTHPRKSDHCSDF